MAARSTPAHGVDPAPNIVLILLDDARVDDMRVMREVTERINGRGATFKRFYSSFPLCCPARATLLTGQYPHNHGVLSNGQPTGGWAEFDDSSTLATWLQPTYRTGLIGKYLNQYEIPYQPPGWDEWMVPKGVYNYETSRWWVDHGLGGTFRELSGYQTDTLATLASDFVERNAPSTEPFFLLTSVVAPHAGVPADPDDPVSTRTPYVKPLYRDWFEGVVNKNPSVNESDVSDKPAVLPLLTPKQIAGLTEAFQQRRESMLSVRDAVEDLMDALVASGELANTYVMVMSDNGFLLGEHRYPWGKVQPYEVSNHVPFAVRGPGIAPGTVVPDVSAQVDFAATVADMAGVEPGLPQDGTSLLPALTEGSRTSRPGILLEATDRDATSDPLPWLYQGVVKGRWKYIERTTGHRELYDLRTDPHELVNLADRAEHATKQSELAALTQRLRSCAGLSCR